MPLAAISKKQTCVSHSTPEAELVAADLALRAEGLPALDIWEVILGRPVKLAFQEDNQAAIVVLRSGYSTALRHMGRTHKVCLKWMHERVENKDIELEYCESSKQAADVFTKAFTEPIKWADALSNINVGPPINESSSVDQAAPGNGGRLGEAERAAIGTEGRNRNFQTPNGPSDKGAGGNPPVPEENKFDRMVPVLGPGGNPPGPKKSLILEKCGERSSLPQSPDGNGLDAAAGMNSDGKIPGVSGSVARGGLARRHGVKGVGISYLPSDCRSGDRSACTSYSLRKSGCGPKRDCVGAPSACMRAGYPTANTGGPSRARVPVRHQRT